MLATDFTRVYSDYQEQCIITEETTQGPERITSPPRECFVDASIVVHKKNLEQSSYEVDALDQYIPLISQQEDDNSDTDGDDSGVPDSFAFDSLFPVIIRKMCSGCSNLRPPLLPGYVIPTSLWWKNSHKISDDCPICHKVLFHKEEFRQNSPCLECETSGDGDDDDKTQGEEVL
jgi:hypothetical protein